MSLVVFLLLLAASSPCRMMPSPRSAFQGRATFHGEVSLSSANKTLEVERATVPQVLAKQHMSSFIVVFLYSRLEMSVT